MLQKELSYGIFSKDKKRRGVTMRKAVIVLSILAGSIFLLTSSLWAGGVEKIFTPKGEVGLPPSALQKPCHIARHGGKGELFYPAADFAQRVVSHRIPAGDKKPGPGWGVPPGHNIGNAPLPPVIGKELDRTEKGKLEIVADFFNRIKQHEASQRKSK